LTILSKPGADLLVICCYCIDWDRNDPMNKGASHGICPPCYLREFGEPLPVPACEERV